MADMAASSGDDRISALPLDVRLRLLTLLPVDEAVRTGVLSREWRGLWKKMHRLRLVGLERFETAESFNVFVNHLIVHRGRLPLDKFKVEVRISDTLESYPYANLWIQYALFCKVRVLDVFCEGDLVGNMGLTVPLVSERLTTLNLCEVDLKNCSALVDSTRSLDLSSCPLLENLRMHHCGIDVSKISSKSLKRLAIISCSLSEQDSRSWISAPNLISLEYSDCLGEAPVLESMPFLQRAFIRPSQDIRGSCDGINPGVQRCGGQSCERCYGYPVGSYQSVLLNGLSNVIHLELIAEPEVYIYRLDLAYCPIFGNLKTLLLNGWFMANGLHGLVCILQHSPILQKLTLLFYNSKGFPSPIEDDGNHDPIEQTFACAHLKVVNIKCHVMNERVSKTLKLFSMGPPSPIEDDGNHDPIEQTFACAHLKVVNIKCQVMNVSKTLKLLSTCGIPPEYIRLKINHSRSYSFSFETASTNDDEAAPLTSTQCYTISQ